jgi:hypothetical protein
VIELREDIFETIAVVKGEKKEVRIPQAQGLYERYKLDCLPKKLLEIIFIQAPSH